MVKMDKANRTCIPAIPLQTSVITSAMPCTKVHEGVLFVARFAHRGQTTAKKKSLHCPLSEYFVSSRVRTYACAGNRPPSTASRFEYARLESKKT